LKLPSHVERALREPRLNAFMALGASAWVEAREAFQEFLRADAVSHPHLLISMERVSMHLPADIGDYSDFYTSLEHATNVGKLFRPDAPLPLNFKHLPLGYHGRASSIVPSGTAVKRPWGQLKEGREAAYAPCQRLDYEMELAAFVGPGNEMGVPIPVDVASGHLFGLVVLNDWSARDVQKWEYVPLGPFNAKNFATTISPWVVTLAALEPYRVAAPERAVDDPQVLPYLKSVHDFAFDITVEVSIRSESMREQGVAPTLISRGNFATMYWTLAQMLAQHTSTGCNMRSGDVIGSGTISGSSRDARGCLLEFTLPDGAPVTLGDGSTRSFLLDGDEVILTAYAQREGLPRIGFGECRGIVLPVDQWVLKSM
jgi:fumarylacetoacetase